MSVSSFGIYPEAIENAEAICEDALQDMKDFAEKVGSTVDAVQLDFDLSENVLDCLKDSINVHNITNSIIGECLWQTKEALEGTQICEDFGITFDTYINCYDSHLYFKHGDVTEEYHGEGDLDDLLNETLAERMSDIICERLANEGKTLERDALKKWLEEDLKRDEYDHDDIAACYSSHEITGTITDAVESFKAEQKNVKSKPTVERD